MKKQNVNNKLAFGKATVTELNDTMMIDVNGGSTPLCVWSFVESVLISISAYAAIKALMND